MELRHLRYFVAVAETRSFTQAAAACYVAQSALSQQIARLEKDVGAALFSRTSRSVRLTAAGGTLLPWARRILADVDGARAELDALAGLERGRLDLGLIQTLASALDLAEVLADYQHRHPGIDLHISNAPSAEMAAAVAAGALDLAVIGLGPGRLPHGVDCRVLDSDPLVAVVPQGHPLADRAVIGLGELADDRLIQFSRGNQLRRQVEEAFERAGVRPDQRFEVGLVGDMVRLAARGLGVTVVPRSAAVGARRAAEGLAAAAGPPDGARVLPLADQAALHRVAVVYDGTRLSAAANAFLATLERHSRGED